MDADGAEPLSLDLEDAYVQQWTTGRVSGDMMMMIWASIFCLFVTNCKGPSALKPNDIKRQAIVGKEIIRV